MRWAAAVPPCLLVGFSALTTLQSRQSRPDAVLFTLGFLIAGFAWASAGSIETRRPGAYPLWCIVTVGLVSRMILLPFGPLFDNDIYRYLWDGHVAAQGINPFLHTPASSELFAIRTSYYRLIGYPEIGTIYPPFAQMIFLAAAKMHLATPALFKLILVPFDLGSALVVAALLRLSGKSLGLLLTYAWSPLVLKEVYNSGHIDIAMVSLAALAVYFVLEGRRFPGGLALGLSVMTKGASALLLPLLAKFGRWWTLLGAVVAGALIIPYSSAGWQAFDGASAYGHYWRFNDGAFYVLYRVEWLLRGHEEASAPYARAAASVLLLGYWIPAISKVGKDRCSFVRAVGHLLLAALLLMPVVDPWYTLWLVPFLGVLQSRASPALCILCALSYLYYWHGYFPPWVRVVEYLPVFAMLLWDRCAVCRRRARSDVSIAT